MRRTETQRTVHLSCDRCGLAISNSDDDTTRPLSWGEVSRGPVTSSNDEGVKDLCPDCFQSFDVWWNTVPALTAGVE